MFGRKRKQLLNIGEYETILDNEPVRYSIKRSYRAKYIRLEIHRQTGLTIYIPRFYKIDELTNLLQKKKSWILKKLDEVKKYHINFPNTEMKSQGVLPYLGKYINYKKQNKPGTVEYIKLEGNTLIIDSNNNTILRQVIESWYKQQAKSIITKKTAVLCKTMNVTYNQLRIRKARTRWGSCSQNGNLNFNWKLVMIPEPVIEYIIVHELAHLKEMNHSQKFWNLVNEYCPQWQQHKKWLKEHEEELTISNL